MSDKQRKKTIHALKSPLPEPSWPAISADLEIAILDILLPLLTPIGQYREEHVPLSRGKHRKRKRKDIQEKHSDDTPAAHEDGGVKANTQLSRPQIPNKDHRPDILRHLMAGFNSTVKHLELMSQRSQFPSRPREEDNDKLANMTMVFACTSILPPVMTDPLPLLAAMASISLEKTEHIRLIPILPASASRIATALKQARVNVLGILADAPGTEELLKMIRSQVDPITVPWVNETINAKYQPVQIHSKEITVSKPGPKNDKRKRGSHDN